MVMRYQLSQFIPVMLEVKNHIYLEISFEAYLILISRIDVIISNMNVIQLWDMYDFDQESSNCGCDPKLPSRAYYAVRDLVFCYKNKI